MYAGAAIAAKAVAQNAREDVTDDSEKE